MNESVLNTTTRQTILWEWPSYATLYIQRDIQFPLFIERGLWVVRYCTFSFRNCCNFSSPPGNSGPFDCAITQIKAETKIKKDIIRLITYFLQSNRLSVITNLYSFLLSVLMANNLINSSILS